MKTVIVTSFDAFGELATNPSQIVVDSLKDSVSGVRLKKVTLPTSYHRSSVQLGELFSLDPLAIVMFGYTDRSDRVRLEQYGRNSDRSTAPDNDGQHGQPAILADAPLEYPTTVDLMPIFNALQAKEIGFSYSVDAGGYVCNHAYYLALHHAHAQGQLPCLFVHVPFLKEGSETEVVRGSQIIVELVAGQGSRQH